jgi:hypothetical protein
VVVEYSLSVAFECAVDREGPCREHNGIKMGPGCSQILHRHHILAAVRGDGPTQATLIGEQVKERSVDDDDGETLIRGECRMHNSIPVGMVGLIFSAADALLGIVNTDSLLLLPALLSWSRSRQPSYVCHSDVDKSQNIQGENGSYVIQTVQHTLQDPACVLRSYLTAVLHSG